MSPESPSSKADRGTTHCILHIIASQTPATLHRLLALASTGACGSEQPIKGMFGLLRVHRCTLQSSLAAAVLRSAQLYAGTAACWRNIACLAFIYCDAVAALSVVHALH